MNERLSPAQKRKDFHALHQSGCFMIPNPWNAGTARCLEDLGFKAIASTSSGHAFANGQADGTQGLDAVLAHLKELADAVNIPLNADFENGFSDDIGLMSENVIRCVETGVAGLSIEDVPQGDVQGLYDFSHSVARVKAARAAIEQSGKPVLLTARSEGFIRGAPDIDQTIRRLKAYADAGADCLYAPGIQSSAHIEAIVQALDGRPVNFLSSTALGFTMQDLADMGVRRISVGGTLARIAMDAFLHAARVMANEGRFDHFSGGSSNADLNQRFARWAT